MKSMASSNTDEEAKAIVEGVPELPKTNFASSATSEDSNESVAAKGEENLPEQKQAMGHKRARFSLKLNTSQPSVHLESSLDIDQLRDSEAYLLDLEKLETSENKNEDVFMKDKGNHQDRRPSLGRKRAQFCLKPITSQLSMSLEPRLDIDQLQDPVEFFSAYENLQNAEKELERQRGVNVTDLNMYDPSTNTPRRRPEILGKSYSYKHPNSSVLSDSDDTLVSFQKTSQWDIPSSSTYDLHQVKIVPDVETQEMEFAVSVVQTENRVNGVLDELLSSSNGNLDGDVALSLLQERLQIKPIDLGKLCIPDIHNFSNDFLALREKLPKTRNTLSDINNILKVLSGEKLVKHTQVVEIPSDPLISTTSAKSSFASISLLKKRTLQTNPSSDPFPAPNINIAAVRSFSVEVFGRQSDQVDMMEELSTSNKLKKMVEDKSTSTKMASTRSQKVTGGDSVNDNRSKLIGVRLNESLGDLEDHDGGINMDDWVMSGSVSKNGDSNDLECGCNKMGENAENMLQETVSFAQSDANIEESTRSYIDVGVEENVEDMHLETVFSAQPDITIEDSRMENWNSSGRSNSTAVEDHALEGSSANPDISPEQQNEERQRVSSNKRCKATKPRGGRQRKVSSCKQSLEEAGSLWNSGLRRSSRITRRPLEYWKGERFLYGRVHNSLPTVIGLKYISPAKGDGKPTFRVKSFVSDDYKELVDLAALH